MFLSRLDYVVEEVPAVPERSVGAYSFFGANLC